MFCNHAGILLPLQVAESGALKKLNVEGGLGAKARAVYGALFAPPAPTAAAEDAAGSSSPSSPSSPRANGSSDAAANGSGGAPSVKLAAGIKSALPLLQQLAVDPPSQLAQLVALEWLLTVSWEGQGWVEKVCVDGAVSWVCGAGTREGINSALSGLWGVSE